MPFFIWRWSFIKKEKKISEIISIKNITEDEIILRNDKRITILKIEPINFKLKSKAEQNMILESYKYFLKQCSFDLQIFIQTRKARIDEHLQEIKECILKDSTTFEMANDYIEFVKLLAESKGSISRDFYIALNTEEKDKETKVNKIIEDLKNCGNIVEVCKEKEITKVFQNCFKKTFSKMIAMAD